MKPMVKSGLIHACLTYYIQNWVGMVNMGRV